MSNLKISELADGGAAQASDKLPVARSGLNYYITNQYLKNFVFGSTGKVDMSAGVTLTVTRTLTMPTDDGTSGYVLATDGAGNTYWTAGGGGGGGSGTVTSVALNPSTTGLTVNGSASTATITTSGTFQLGGTLAIANGGTGQTSRQTALNALSGAVTDKYYLRGDGTDVSMSALQAGDITGTVAVTNGGTGTSSPSLVAGTNITITGTWPNQTINAAGGGGSMVYPGAGIAYSTGSAWDTSYTTSGTGTKLALTNSPVFNDDITVGTASSATGVVKLNGTTSGTVSLSVADTAGTWTLKLPTTAGTTGYVLSTDGTGVTSWVAQSGGGGGSPGGSDTQVQFNDGGSTFGGDAGFTYNKTTGSVTIAGNVSGGTFNKVTVTAPATGATLTLANNSTLATSGPNSITLTSTGATNVTLPTSGTLLAGTVAIANGGTGQTSQQDAINALAGAVANGYFLRGNGTNVVMNSIQVSDVPTLNQNTTGTAANVTGTVAVANGGTGVSAAGITAFNNITGYQAAGATGTTTTNLVFSTNPTLVTPTLGEASATSINKVAITAPATSATLTIADGKTLTANHSITLAGTDSTTMTFPSTSSTIAAAGKQTIWIPAAAMYKRTTNGAAYSTSEIATNFEMLSYFAFDSNTAEYVQFNVHMPKSWNEGTVIAQFVWTHPATTANFGVNWNIQGYAFSDGDNISATFGAAQTVDDSGGNTSYCYISAETSAVTIGGTPAQNDWVVFQVYRNPTVTSDSMAVDAYLLGVKIIYTTDAPNDN